MCIRFLLYNSGDKVEQDGYVLQYTINGGTNWYNVTSSSSYVQAADHPYRTNDQATSQELGSGTFDEGYWVDDGQTPDYQLANGQESEHEFSFQFLSTDCAGETVGLRICFDDGITALDGYTYSNPSSTFSAGDVYVTPAQAEANASTISPAVVLGSLSLTPGIATANASTIDPTALLGTIMFTPGVAESLASSIDPTVFYSSHSMTPGIAEALASCIDPAVFYGSHSMTPGFAEADASTIDPSVQEGGDLQVTPAFAESDAGAIDPTVVLGSLSLTPGIAEALASCIDPALIMSSVSVTPAQAIALALAMNPNVLDGGAPVLRRWVALNLLTLGVGGRRG